MPLFETRVQLQATREVIFDFLLQPKNAEQLAPPGTEVEIIDAPEIIEIGSFIEFDIGGFGPKQRFVHEIIEINRPHRIVERQYEGPFKAFERTTELRSDGNGAVELIDHIHFEPPGGLLGFLLTESRIRSMLEEGYEHRHKELQRRFSE